MPLRAVFLLLLSSVALAEEPARIRLRVSLTGLYVGEQQDASAALNESASTLALGYGELRASIEAERLRYGFGFDFDTRIRLTSGFSTDSATVGANQTSARGYLGGNEYELRTAAVTRQGAKVDITLGRFLVAEADGLKLDGARLVWRMARHWEGAAFAGAYPNPFSRSLTTDYAGGTFAGGLSVRYAYDRYWGWFSATGSWLSGLDDGGPFNPANPTAGVPTVEKTRSFLSWVGFERLTSWLDAYHNLVLDVAGAAGAQMTRADIVLTARARRFTARLGYGHLSPLAIEMYLTSLLASRADFAIANTITNNLLVQRTARDQGRVELQVDLGKLHIFGDGRLRYRSLVDATADPQFASGAPSLAGDVTLGLRDSGSWRGLRGSLYYTWLGAYRAQSHIFGLDVGRSFLDERLTADFAFLYAKVRDAGAGQTCTTVDTTNFVAALTAGCFGTRDGNDFELGLTLTANPWRRWFALVDYRAVFNQTDGHPLLVTHVLLMRIEARWSR
jgi:hypothetical protein